MEEYVKEVMEKIKNGPYYSEISDKKLEEAIKSYLHLVYAKHMKVITRELKEKNIDKSNTNSYVKAFEEIENKVIYATYEMAAVSLEDLYDLERF